MRLPIAGLHHVTAIASDPQRNLDFYTRVLGLRLVKRTVNFDDPDNYHFYFGDDTGTPGTILTFFPWPEATRGHAGVGEVDRVRFSIPARSIDFWEQRLLANSFSVERTRGRVKQEVLTFPDPDGMKIDLVGAVDTHDCRVPRFAPIPPEHAIRGLFGVTLMERHLESTAAILNILGFHKVEEQDGRHRFAARGKALGNHIDVVVNPSAPYGSQGAGTVHHIAFRVPDDTSQLEWRDELQRHLKVTPVRDRTYFHSIYFREPGGVLFELATDPPGFIFDETVEELGNTLKLPEWLEPNRTLIVERLPPIELHKSFPPIELLSENGDSI